MASNTFGTSPSHQEIVVLRAENLDRLGWLVHGFSTRKGGVSQVYGRGTLNLGHTPEDTREAVESNRELFLKAAGAAGMQAVWPLITMQQVHSAAIHHIDSQTAKRRSLPNHPLAGDGLITNEPGLALGIKAADCLPILLVDVRCRAVCALHAGWRGTLSRIAEKGVGEMRRWFGSQPKDILAAIGPGIHVCCYRVGQELYDQFSSQFSHADELFEEDASNDEIRRKYPLLFMNMRAPGHGEPPRRLRLNLVEANCRQLLSCGLPARNIEVLDLCTACRTDLLFSHRGEQSVTGRMLAVVGIRSDNDNG